MTTQREHVASPTDRVRLDPGAAALRTPAQAAIHLRDGARSRVAHTKRFRLAQLDAFDRMLSEHRQDFLGALAADLGKGDVEAQATELQIVQHEVDHARRHLEDWMRTRTVPSPFVLAPVTTTVTARPLGMVLVIAP